MIDSRGNIGDRRIVTIMWLLGFYCLLLALVWLLGWTDATRKVDRLLHDSWVRSSQRAVPDDIVIAAIDPPSLEHFGRWPWPRDLQAQLFEQLARQGVRAVIADLIYTESAAAASSDDRLAAAIASLDISILPVLTEGIGGGVARDKLPVPILTRAVTDIGHIFLPIDDDGIVRRVPLKSGFKRPHWPALSLAALAKLEPEVDWLGEHLPGLRLPLPDADNLWVQDHEVLIPFYGPSGTFKRYSAASIIRGEIDDEALRDRIVLFGLTTAGLGDVVPTPVSALDQPVAGVEIHANMLAALRDGSLVTGISRYSNLLVAALLLPLMLLLYSRAPPQWDLSGALVGAAIPVLISWLFYDQLRLWYAPLSASVVILVSYLLWSRHRLDFVNRFLERESGKFELHLPQRDSRSNQLLVDFFESAIRHLPINAWRFDVQGDVFMGGTRLLPGSDIVSEQWTEHHGVYTRRYPTSGLLKIDVAISDADNAVGIMHYIDTLARIQSRSEPSRLGGSIERLQANAQKLSEQMAWLRSVKVFSETVLESTPLGLLIWNPAGELVRGNSLAQRLLPSLAEKPLFVDFVRAIGRQPDEGADKAAFRALLMMGQDWQATTTEGDTELVINMSAVGKQLANRLICASIIDVSAIRTAERARAEMVDYLSHDLRSPLISALYLLDDAGTEFSAEERAVRIEQNIQRSLVMMDDLLHVARADGLDEQKFSEVLFNAVVDNALDQLLPQARSRKIQVDIDTTEKDLWMNGDAASLERAVVNVIGNAIKYSQEGGRVCVCLSGVAGEALLQITDQGVGIDPAMMKDLFTRFRRDATTSDKFKGIGLGLALVSRVVKQHGGEVNAASTGSGTLMSIRLPVIDPEVIEQADAVLELNKS